MKKTWLRRALIVLVLALPAAAYAADQLGVGAACGDCCGDCGGCDDCPMRQK